MCPQIGMALLLLDQSLKSDCIWDDDDDDDDDDDECDDVDDDCQTGDDSATTNRIREL